MNEKWTPGPWEVGGELSERIETQTASGASKGIARLVGSHPEQDANARLIAAAPENYGELQAAYEQALAQFKAGDKYATFNKQTVAAWGHSLTKARGE